MIPNNHVGDKETTSNCAMQEITAVTVFWDFLGVLLSLGGGWGGAGFFRR